jgi:hypothetical protein
MNTEDTVPFWLNVQDEKPCGGCCCVKIVNRVYNPGSAISCRQKIQVKPLGVGRIEIHSPSTSGIALRTLPYKQHEVYAAHYAEQMMLAILYASRSRKAAPSDGIRFHVKPLATVICPSSLQVVVRGRKIQTSVTTCDQLISCRT